MQVTANQLKGSKQIKTSGQAKDSNKTTASKPTIAGRGIQSIETGARLLKVLVQTARPMMLSELAEEAGLPRGQVHAYLVSYRNIGLVEQDPASSLYKLGPFALHLGLAKLRDFNPLNLATDAVVAFARDLDLMVSLTIWGTHGPTVVRVQETSHVIHANLRVGTVFSLIGTATGRVFAAYMPKQLIDPLIKADIKASAKSQTGIQRPTLKTVRFELDEIRQKGLACTEDKPVPGLSALSAPIFDFSGQLQLVVTIIGPSGIVDVSLDGRHATALLDFTANVSSQLGYIP